MNLPEFGTVLQELRRLLEGYEVTTLTFLDAHGTWRRSPQTLRDRISNELWFKIWEGEQSSENSSQLEDLVYPLVRDEGSWALTKSIYRQRVSDPRRDRSALALCEALYFLVEYDAYDRISRSYVADWDYRGKTNKARCTERAGNLLCEVKRSTSDTSMIDSLLEMVELLNEDQEGIFTRVSLVISEEEKIRNQIGDMFAELPGKREESIVYGLISEQISSAMKMATTLPASLLRPCLELISNPEIEISSGLPYDTTSILGQLADVRSMDALVHALEICPLRYTNLRCNIIFALGNLRHQKTRFPLVKVLDQPESTFVPRRDGSGYNQPLRSEKIEAIWALGKMAHHALEALPALLKYTHSEDKEIRIPLAWALGMIGQDQKKRWGGVDASLAITLMHLLMAKDTETFEEAAVALRNLGLPDFLHTLYLHTFATVPLLTLKPSSSGLYELSETILHLVSIKRPVVMAVTGDSGTGKTYFCQAIAQGFGELGHHEILYLMRDSPTNGIFNRILGLKWLKEHIDAKYYEDYSPSDDDEPDKFFEAFIQDHSDKKLIILDGWRDKDYFHQVIRTFYKKGYLDVLVKFRTTYSTRRINLEEREGSLERVKDHLPLVEKPDIEETSFYREGSVLIYHLDNSITSRLKKEEILEVFKRRKVGAWGDYIRIGEFRHGGETLRSIQEMSPFSLKTYAEENEVLSPQRGSPLNLQEATVSRVLNDNIEEEPNLLQSVVVDNLSVTRIAFYTQGQLACCGDDGSVGIITGYNDRIFLNFSHEGEVVHLAVLGEDICTVDCEGTLKITSFHKNTTIDVGTSQSPVSSMTSDRHGRIITGHHDGAVRIWNISGGRVTLLRGHEGPVFDIAVDRHGRIFSASNELRVWDADSKKVTIFTGFKKPIRTTGVFPDGRVLTTAEAGEKRERRGGIEIRILDTTTGVYDAFHLPHDGMVNTSKVYFDGRIILGLKNRSKGSFMRNLIVLDPRPGLRQLHTLGRHGFEIKNCVTMGPRIITCGIDEHAEQTLRIWGTELYVKMDHDTLMLIPESMEKPPYYRTLF